ncbi:GMC family oxidoreductase [Aspergillus saccharolyticus JOP 1030-1]|uniref:Alcohol oxidase n=1 Tax=Aspergillus saccharolyticus JOP 1030-1 TaxID=1450539 RepID=A0A318Z1R7_9EURO|nr:alcohol oxidase [Aspergillus saccharolyticus JOP 1030-1]PYH40869.1 alcohol oxidase [Aspergillus saccharolyticus JOP 1030-1]
MRITFWALPVAAAAISPWYSTSPAGITRLTGSSFGILGINATFDYVIVGGGTAGLTIAARLAENVNLSIAVIEAGGFYEQDNSNVSQIPAYAVEYSSASPSTIQPEVDWGIVTSSQPQLNDREIHYTQGKCLGGGSGRNYLIYHRGTIGTYQRWADMVQDDSYTFSNLLPYFQKSGQFTPPNYEKRGSNLSVKYDPSAFSSQGGPLQISYFNYYLPFSTYVRKAWHALGFQELAGANSGTLLGYADITATLDPVAEVRSSSETSFLQTAMAKSSLQVYQATLANRILFNDTQATGVEVTTAGSRYVLSARKEVILSAGVFRSPQLLLLSGIGPESTLDAFEIPVVANLSGVGQNILDHPFFDTTYRASIPTQTQLTTNATFLAEAEDAYLREQRGPLTASAGNYIGWENLPQPYRSQLSNTTLAALASFPADWPELQYVPVAAATVSTNDTDPAHNYMSWSVTLVATTSRGNLTLNSTNAQDNPLLNIGWLSTPADQELAVAGLKRARQLATASGLIVGDEIAPGTQVQSDEQILEYIRSEVRPMHHAVASCAMGPAGDPDAVVDSQGRVFGVKGLRVVDSSVFPLLPPGQIQATVYMLAEKIADRILQGLTVD